MARKFSVAIITPFKKDRTIDYEYFSFFLPLLENNGVNAIIAFGTNGEGPSVSLPETEKALQGILDHSGKMEVFTGIFRNNISEALDFIKTVENYSITGILLTPPFYFKNLKDEGLVEYFTKILEDTSLSTILYNIPKYTGVSLTQTLIEKLTDFSQIIGIKDSSGNIEQTKLFIRNFPKLEIYSGSDALVYESLQLGCKGVITALANTFPRVFSELVYYSSNESYEKAKMLQNWITTVRSITKQYPQISSIKICMEKYLELPRTYVRPPLVNLTEQEKNQMYHSLDKIVK